ncbi:MAG: LysR family transcriptional regulator [Pseudomonadota bacterium]
MNFSLRQVEVYWAVMTTGSATAAATLLRTSQPTISRELARFEKLTGLVLFQRGGGKLVPTEHGLMLFEEVQRSYLGLERIGSAAEAIRHFRQGQITLTCLPAFSTALLPRVCQQFGARFPGVSLSITPQESPALEESLTAQRYHLGLSEHQSAPPGTAIETLLSADVVCVLPPGHALCAQSVLTPRHFAGQDCIYLAGADPYRLKIDQLFRELGIVRKMAVETHSASAVCATVRLGAGIAIVNPLTALDYAPQGLQIRRFSHSIAYAVCLVRPLHRPASTSVAQLEQVLRQSCRDIGATLERMRAAS